jgi:hypothetical protein
MQDSKQVLKVELQRLYMSKENETLVMEALRHAHGDVSITTKLNSPRNKILL